MMFSRTARCLSKTSVGLNITSKAWMPIEAIYRNAPKLKTVFTTQFSRTNFSTIGAGRRIDHRKGELPEDEILHEKEFNDKNIEEEVGRAMDFESEGHNENSDITKKMKHKEEDGMRNESFSVEKHQDRTDQRTKTLYIGNIPWDVREEELSEFLKNYADVFSVRIITDRFTGRSRGFGYAQVKSRDFFDLVEKLQGVIYKGRSLRVNEATVETSRPRSQRKPYPNNNRGNEVSDRISNQRMYKYQPKDKFRNKENHTDVLNELSEEQVHSPNKSFF